MESPGQCESICHSGESKILCCSKDISKLKPLIALFPVSGGSLRDQLRFLHVSSPQQKPTRSIEEPGNNRETGRNRITLDISWSLVARV
jgi:hypothetical protein